MTCTRDNFPPFPFPPTSRFLLAVTPPRDPKREEEGALHMNSEFPYPQPNPTPRFPFTVIAERREGELLLSGLPSPLSSCANVTLLLLLRNHRFGPISIGDKILNSKFAYFTFAVNMYSRFNLDILQDRYRICKKIPLLPPLPMYFLDLFNAMSA